MVIQKGPDQHKCEVPGEDHNEEDDVSDEGLFHLPSLGRYL